MQLEILLTIVMLILSLISVAGLPGPLLISLIVFGYAYGTGFQTIGLVFAIIYILLGLFGVLVDNLLALLGAKKFGASRAGSIGAFIGTILVFLLGPFGIIIGPFVGALIGEIVFAKKKADEAVKAAIGAVVGLLSGIFAKVILALAMTIGFALVVF